MPIKPLSFKGDKKLSKKRKHHESSLNDSGIPKSSSATVDDDDSWTSPAAATDLAGPAIIVLPTNPPTCLASDANGRIFASPLENMVDQDPRTAEPHDVRQVWVATKMPGTSGNTGTHSSVEIGFKGAHGGWLSCDSVGVLGATREARGMEEAFILEQASNNEEEEQSSTTGRTRGGWLLRTAATKKAEGDEGKKYISAVATLSGTAALGLKAYGADSEDGNRGEENGHETKPSTKSISLSLRGDGTSDELSTRLILRMQARFLPMHASGGGGGGGGVGGIVATRNTGHDKVSRSEMEKAVGRRLEDDEVKRLKRARKQGMYHEEVLDMRSKGKHDKFA